MKISKYLKSFESAHTPNKLFSFILSIKARKCLIPIIAIGGSDVIDILTYYYLKVNNYLYYFLSSVFS